MQTRLGESRRILHGGLAAWIALASLAGCGQKQAPAAKAHGTVTHMGQPVTAGTIVVIPPPTEVGPAKPASGSVKPDGTFTLSTYRPDDGAPVGKCRVQYDAPPPTPVAGAPAADAHAEVATTPSPYAKLVAQPDQVEIKPGDNNIVIELVAPPVN